MKVRIYTCYQMEGELQSDAPLLLDLHIKLVHNRVLSKVKHSNLENTDFGTANLCRYNRISLVPIH